MLKCSLKIMKSWACGTFLLLATTNAGAQEYTFAHVDQAQGAGNYVTAPSINESGMVVYVAGGPSSTAINVWDGSSIRSAFQLGQIVSVGNHYNWDPLNPFPNPASCSYLSMGAYPRLTEWGDAVFRAFNGTGPIVDGYFEEISPPIGSPAYSCLASERDLYANPNYGDYHYNWFDYRSTPFGWEITAVCILGNQSAWPRLYTFYPGTYNHSVYGTIWATLSGDNGSHFASIHPFVVRKDVGVCFYATKDDGITHGIYVSYPGGAGPDTVVEPIAETPGPYGDVQGGMHMNNLGDVVFVGLNAQGKPGLFKYHPGAISTISTIVDPSSHFTAIYYPSLNDSGRIVFLGFLDDGTWGYYNGPNPQGDRIIGLGDQLDGSVLVRHETFFNTGWNNSSQLTFSATLSDGRMVIVRGTPNHSVISISPQAALQGSGPFNLTVTGGTFYPGASVRWNGSARPTTFVSSSQLIASLTAADVATAGIVPVSVRDGDGVITNAVNFAVLAPLVPHINSISPFAAVQGGPAFTLTVNGARFEPTSVVTWGSSPRATHYVSPSQVTADIPASDLANLAYFPIRVFNPGANGGTSNVTGFGVVPPAVTVVLRNNTYNPSDVTVALGQRIIFRQNDPGELHTVTRDMTSLAGPDSPDLGYGTAYNYTVPLTVPHGSNIFYHCKYYGAAGNGTTF